MQTHNEQFTQMHNSLYGKVFSFVKLRVYNTDEAKDIVQDVFIKAYNSWKQMPDENTARNFLFLIAKQRMIDLWRSARHKNGFDTLDESEFENLEDKEPLPEDMFVNFEKRQYVLKLLNNLKPGDRELLVLRFLEELEYVELAKIYKISEDNIRQKVSRALQSLRNVATKE